VSRPSGSGATSNPTTDDLDMEHGTCGPTVP
jgi:hypothetical protein